ncbi:uncharacterized protein [Amphiura filiformis]|uniref:uncharacterized protein n=1 Tax=Amphiura filiformis TaxID=82378 RepID=UPI003B216476
MQLYYQKLRRQTTMADGSVSSVYAINATYKEDFECLPKQDKNKNTTTHDSHNAPRRIRMNELEFLNKIGKGATSVVFAVNLCNRLAAAKKVNEIDSDEVALTRHFCHPNIIHLFGIVDEVPNAYIVMELAPHGSLDKYLRSLDKDLSQDALLNWIGQASAAVEYLHQQGIVHRDIKSPNYLISGDKVLKLCDFGLARPLDATVTTTTRGSLPWMPPEVMTEHKVSKPGDVYSLGTVIWEICTRKIPYEGLDFLQIQTQVCSKGKRPEIPDGLSRHLIVLLKRCWMTDRNKRPTMPDVMKIINAMKMEAAYVIPSRSSSSEGNLTYFQIEFGRSSFDGARGICNYIDNFVAVASRKNGAVGIYDVTNGTKKFSLGEADDHQLRDPVDVTYTPDQSFFVLESSGTIVQFDEEGKFKGKLHLETGNKGRCKPAYCIDTTPQGHLLVGAGNTLSILSTGGTLTPLALASLKNTLISEVRPHYITTCMNRHEVAISGEGYIEIVDLCTGKVKVKRPIPIVAGICYSEDSNHLHVVRRLEPYGPGIIDKHSALTGDFIVSECGGLERPGGATLISVGTLAVADWDSVKVFT